MSRNKHLTKLCIKCPLHLKYVLALPWEIRSVRSSRQRNVHFNESLNSGKHDWQLLLIKNRQTRSNPRNVRLQRERKRVDSTSNNSVIQINVK